MSMQNKIAKPTGGMAGKLLKVKKNEREALDAINYMLGQKGSIPLDPTMTVRWTPINSDCEDIEGFKNEWVQSIRRARDYCRWHKDRGRPFKNTMLHISDDQQINLNHMRFIDDFLWDFLRVNISNSYMGLIAYHYRDAFFHFHLGINPVPLDPGSGDGIFRISKHDLWWKNGLYDVEYKGLAKLSRGLSMRYPESDFSRAALLKLINEDEECIESLRKSGDEILLHMTLARQGIVSDR